MDREHRVRNPVRGLLLGYFAVLLGILVATVPTLISTLRTLDRQRSTFDVASAGASQLLVGALNMETGMRGYALTGQHPFLQPFELGTKQYESALRELRSVNLGPTFKSELASTANRIGTWRRSAEVINNDVENHNMGAARAVIERGSLKTRFDAFRRSQSRLSSTVQQELEANRNSLHEEVTRTLLLLGLGVGCGIVIGIVLWLRWQIWGRRAAVREARLADRAILLQSAIDASSESIYAKDREGRHLLSNRARAAALTGGDGDADLIGRTVEEFVEPAVAEDIQRNEQQVIRTGAERQFQEVLPFPDGPHVFAITKSPLRDREGAVTGVVGVARDITEQLELLADRERLYQLQHRLAESLQLSMLGLQDIDDPRMDVCATYIAAADELAVGGDWYDVLSLPNDRFGLIVGDAVGHGVDSVMAMGQLRNALAALALVESDPAATLESLDLFVTGMAHAQWATCLLAIVDPTQERLTYSCAGHMPPLIAIPDAAPEIVFDRQDPPLAVRPGVPRRSTSVPFPVGSIVVLYTDGLVERRNEVIDAGMERLVALVDDLRDEPTETLCGELIDRLVDPSTQSDDATVLAARLCGDRSTTDRQANGRRAVRG